MPGFPKYDIAAMLGFTPIATVTDEEIWLHLVTPVVKAILGPVTERGVPQVTEATPGFFPGDESSNQNNHLLYGGKTGFIRHPIIVYRQRHERGQLITKRDGRKIKADCYFGSQAEIDKGNGKLILSVGLKDRRYDGTSQGNDSGLLHFPYDHPVFHKPLHPEAAAVEISVYSFNPGSRISEATGEPEFESFIEKPFTFIDRPEVFLTYFHRAWKTAHAPGMVAAPVPDASKFLLKGFEHLATSRGYDFLESASSHYHVAKWFQAAGYRYSYQHDAETLNGFAQGLEAIRNAGHPLNRVQQSWVCVIQSLPQEHIPEHLRLPGLIWPQDNIGPQNLWQNKPLTKRALALVPQPLSA